jgi:Nif-specific regulatory protein
MIDYEKITHCIKNKQLRFKTVKEFNMRSALDLNKVSTLSTVLLTNLDENIFFSQLSSFVLGHFQEYKVQAYEAFQDGSTVLKAENGKAINNGIEYAKGQGLSGYVTRMKRAYYSNSRRDPLLATTKRDEKVECELAIPVISDGLVLGTIHIQSNNPDRKFNDEDVAEVNAILTHLEAAINNMKMYLIAKNLNRELENKIKEKEEELSQRGPVLKTNKGRADKVEIIGHSNAIVDVLNIAKKIAKEDFPVLVHGQTGTGKKLIAKKIHSMSDRKDAECLTVHCEALGEEQLAVELFGRSDRPGVLQRAHGGTVILDGVDELPSSIQAKLLRAIISGELYNVDSNTPVAMNVRIISTVNKNIETAVEEGRFREDLLYRLNIVSIAMPKLHERHDDIKVLAEYFLNLGKKPEDYKILTSSAIEKLAAYNWPGNIQELRNIMERTYILADDKYVDEQHLPKLVKEVQMVEAQAEDFSEMTLHDLEKLHICRTLDHVEGNKTKAAKVLGITVKTLYNKLHSYGLVSAKAE